MYFHRDQTRRGVEYFGDLRLHRWEYTTVQDVTYLKNNGHRITSSMPIHRAINNNAPSDTIIMLAEMYPECLLEPHSDGKLEHEQINKLRDSLRCVQDEINNKCPLIVPGRYNRISDLLFS